MVNDTNPETLRKLWGRRAIAEGKRSTVLDRERIAADTEAFLANGGTIEVVTGYKCQPLWNTEQAFRTIRKDD